MIELKLNLKVIEYLREEGFYPDTMVTSLMVMECLKKGKIHLLDCLDDNNTSKRAALIYFDLIRKELVEEGAGATYYVLTQKGEDFMENVALLGQDKKKKQSPATSDAWIAEWLEMWPADTAPSGKELRSDEQDCCVRMNKFLRQHKYSKDIIMEATAAYLEEARKRDWQYTRTALYFIEKRGDGSELAAQCAKVLRNNTLVSDPVTVAYTSGLI